MQRHQAHAPGGQGEHGELDELVAQVIGPPEHCLRSDHQRATAARVQQGVVVLVHHAAQEPGARLVPHRRRLATVPGAFGQQAQLDVELLRARQLVCGKSAIGRLDQLQQRLVVAGEVEASAQHPALQTEAAGGALAEGIGDGGRGSGQGHSRVSAPARHAGFAPAPPE